ncbi:sensor histidine kinase [Phyllobacterium myrsinacearum]|uniref:Sensor histidine kinase YesM n=1 Tax=Phyllobacterium myrsinacearum TaxID=28101 RepID=A0A839ESX1_9HYPH|nr:histidine kinase [Phyllobacterium myrsinacearum]MBA8879700.1 sensor histidine kinase YesM [Phyllobacterium myrsinacearum]
MKNLDIDRSALEIFRMTLLLVSGFWAAEFMICCLLWTILGVSPWEYIPIKAVVSLLSIILTLIVTYIIAYMRNINLIIQVFICFVLSILSSTLTSVLDYYLYNAVHPSLAIEYNLANFCYTLFYGLSLFFGWSSFFVAYLYNLEIRAHERRLAASREEALNAKMQALHYQINPHFLFNTLNSVVGLIEEGAPASASRMIMSLSSFLRSTLELDPLRDLPLADELALQAAYLKVESERFSDRMNVTLHVPHELEGALVPSLILQPLVENAVKHGLGYSSGNLEIVISAFREGQSLKLLVENDSKASDKVNIPDRTGLGIGLSNVAHRIQTRFPQSGTLVAGPVSPSRFRALLTMPLRLA